MLLESVILHDLIANQPAAGIVGRLFFASDTGVAYRDNGSSWDVIVTGGGSLPNFADDETVSGSGTSWTLANTPSPAGSLQLFQDLPGFGLVGLKQGTDYTLSGASITIVNSATSGSLRAWYRY